MEQKLFIGNGKWSLRLLFLSIALTTSVFSFAQLSEKGYPYSYLQKLKKTAKIPVYNLKSFNKEKLNSEDKENPSPFRYSIFEEVNTDIKQDALRTDIASEGGEIWRYKIVSKEAKSIQLFFKKYIVPSGAKLFIYNEDYSRIYGAFTDKNISTDGTFMVADFKGEEVIIEYFEPYNKTFEGQIVLGSVGQAYKDIFQAMYSIDAEGYIGINCPEGETWQDQKHSVCLITFNDGSSGYLCSGALMNTTKNDATPYFLTANHCLSEETVAHTVVAYFNYEQIGCNGPSKNNQTLSGATLKTTGAQSDFTLLLFYNAPPIEYQPYYSGWNSSEDPGLTSTGIHHPDGKPKKISIDNSSATSYNKPITWDNGTTTLANTHWEVSFDKGKTFGGSSGSPIYDENKRIFGQLHGGDDLYEYYGKLSYSWTHESTGYNTLKSFLDPDNTGAAVIDGYYFPNTIPDPQLLSEFSNVCQSAPVQMTGFSAFAPISWSWSFLPNTVTYLNGTDSTSKDPIVSFDSPGSYSASLTVLNNAGSNEINRLGAISSGNNLNLEIFPLEIKDSCLYDFDSLILFADGAASFMWNLQTASADKFYIVNDTVNPVVIHMLDPSSINASTDILLEVMGTHGSCTSSESYSFPLIAQSNDNIENAIQINMRINGPFSNKCATIQTGEPVPPHNSCTGQDSWCDEYNTGDNIVEHSVWFYFIPTSDKKLELRSEGFDDQIAVYSANSYQDILNGNYILIGANDDHTLTDFNPIIEKMAVTQGNTYWVQVDGSAGGEEGSFYLYLDESTYTSVNNKAIETGIRIYPQPADDYVTLECNCFNNTGSVSVTIYSISGFEIYSGVFDHPDESSIHINTANWNTGIYLVKIIYEGGVISTKIIK